MPPKLHALKHPKLRNLKQRATKLSRHSVPLRKCTLADRQESKEYFHCQLESFQRYIRDHYIGAFGSSHKVLAKGKYSRQYYATSLRSLLALDTIPDQIEIPCWHLPHKCAYCHAHPYPHDLWLSLFVHISAVPCHHGRPSRNDAPTSTAIPAIPQTPKPSTESTTVTRTQRCRKTKGSRLENRTTSR